MVPELHHKWNAERDPSRKSDAPIEKDTMKPVPANRVTLKQNRPR